jgi:ubiquinone/menaquinone biosynthesis C-methylase UbiE
MYHRIALDPDKKTSLSGKKVLDLACGRGGGLAFLAEHFEILQGVGIDLCKRQISFAADTFKEVKGCELKFYQGDVETIS